MHIRLRTSQTNHKSNHAAEQIPGMLGTTLQKKRRRNSRMVVRAISTITLANRSQPPQPSMANDRQPAEAGASYVIEYGPLPTEPYDMGMGVRRTLPTRQNLLLKG